MGNNHLFWGDPFAWNGYSLSKTEIKYGSIFLLYVILVLVCRPYMNNMFLYAPLLWTRSLFFILCLRGSWRVKPWRKGLNSFSSSYGFGVFILFYFILIFFNFLILIFIIIFFSGGIWRRRVESVLVYIYWYQFDLLTFRLLNFLAWLSDW